MTAEKSLALVTWTLVAVDVLAFAYVVIVPPPEPKAEKFVFPETRLEPPRPEGHRSSPLIPYP